MQPVEQRCPSVGNPGASHSLDCLVPGAGANARFGPRAPCDPVASAGTGWRPRAARRLGLDASSHGCSNGCRGRNGCTTPPGSGSARKGTDGRDAHPYTPRTGRRCWTDSSQRATLRWHRLQRPRCRARHGHQQACLRGGSLPRPPTSTSLTLYCRRSRMSRALHCRCCRCPPADWPRAGHRPFKEIAFAGMAALGRPCRRTSCVPIRHQQADPSPNLKTLPRHRLTAVPDQRSQPNH